MLSVSPYYLSFEQLIIPCISGVLGALSQVQKEHKRHAVHLATLRAQGFFFMISFSLPFYHVVCIVKKTAQARKDKLGPKWSSWVGKAVHKLVSFGVSSK
jgi:hypothetical protein